VLYRTRWIFFICDGQTASVSLGVVETFKQTFRFLVQALHLLIAGRRGIRKVAQHILKCYETYLAHNSLLVTRTIPPLFFRATKRATRKVTQAIVLVIKNLAFECEFSPGTISGQNLNSATERMMGLAPPFVIELVMVKGDFPHVDRPHCLGGACCCPAPG
jgi:hypothetical protein